MPSDAAEVAALMDDHAALVTQTADYAALVGPARGGGERRALALLPGLVPITRQRATAALVARKASVPLAPPSAFAPALSPSMRTVPPHEAWIRDSATRAMFSGIERAHEHEQRLSAYLESSRQRHVVREPVALSAVPECSSRDVASYEANLATLRKEVCTLRDAMANMIADTCGREKLAQQHTELVAQFSTLVQRISETCSLDEVRDMALELHRRAPGAMRWIEAETSWEISATVLSSQTLASLCIYLHSVLSAHEARCSAEARAAHAEPTALLYVGAGGGGSGGS